MPEGRKRDGAVYTPEPLALRIVELALGPKLEQLRRGPLDAHAQALDQLTVLDFACGDGVLLVAALRRLVDERRWIAEAQARLAGVGVCFDEHRAARAIVTRNLYGLDIDAKAVARAQAALARSCGVTDLPQTNLHVADALDGSFDWFTMFPAAAAGFDCIVGNPPYVKYQVLRRSKPALADHLRNAKTPVGDPVYATTQRGNFDLYVPFIERGLQLLAPDGRMGLLAPSLWIKQGYGEALRRLVRERQALAFWQDFGDVQHFEGATTYTALQVFSARPNHAIEVVRDGEASTTVTHAQLPETGPWTLADEPTLALLRRLSAEHVALVDFVASISVGVQTSADDVYHVEELEARRYAAAGGVFELEAHVHKLVSGADVGRYAQPSPRRRIIFPYDADAELLDAEQLRQQAPRLWAYLCKHEARLRGRERGRCDDDRWYRFGRSQNIDKQGRAKVLIPRIVRHLRAAPDPNGELVADNVDVCYVIPKCDDDLWYLLAILNGKVADWCFRQTAKPFRGGYYSANKQGIAQLPVPRADTRRRRIIGELARRLGECGSEGSAALEAELDEQVLALYELSEAERELLDGARR